jgi:hypothetical protein
MKIVHLWDQANFVKNLVASPDSKSLNIEYFPKLPDFGLGRKIVNNSARIVPFAYSRLLDRYITNKSRSQAYFEFHSSPLLERHSELIPRSILHVHGSEVRRITGQGQIEDTTTEFTRFALQSVPLVFYSTPELIEVIGKYTNRAVWIPHISSIRYPNPSSSVTSGKLFDLVVPSSFEVWKGSQRVLDLLIELKKSMPSLKLAGIDLGVDKESAREIGVELAKVSVQRKYHSLLMSSESAIGQGFGVISAADIESIQLGLRYFPITVNTFSKSSYDFRDDDLPKPEEISTRLNLHLLNFGLRFNGFEQKVKQAHDPSAVISRMNLAYRTYLT